MNRPSKKHRRRERRTAHRHGLNLEQLRNLNRQRGNDGHKRRDRQRIDRHRDDDA
jgi:hypothetical protein